MAKNTYSAAALASGGACRGDSLDLAILHLQHIKKFCFTSKNNGAILQYIEEYQFITVTRNV
jgi:hypothetical protein